MTCDVEKVRASAYKKYEDKCAEKGGEIVHYSLEMCGDDSSSEMRKLKKPSKKPSKKPGNKPSKKTNNKPGNKPSKNKNPVKNPNKKTKLGARRYYSIEQHPPVLSKYLRWRI
jgi:hypothetical protein